MSDTLSCTEDDVTSLVHDFYAMIRKDAVLGPIFNTHVHDWDEHLAHLVDFWSAMLRGTTRFSGSPMQKHAMIPDLNEELFERWLALFQVTADQQPNQDMAQEACSTAERVAKRLWMGYQYSRGIATR